MYLRALLRFSYEHNVGHPEDDQRHAEPHGKDDRGHQGRCATDAFGDPRQNIEPAKIVGESPNQPQGAEGQPGSLRQLNSHVIL